jgi:hypothetical protein
MLVLAYLSVMSSSIHLLKATFPRLYIHKLTETFVMSIWDLNLYYTHVAKLLPCMRQSDDWIELELILSAQPREMIMAIGHKYWLGALC